MRYYAYSEPFEDVNIDRLIGETEIVKRHWDEWRAGMEKKYGRYSDLITRENCIKDWCTIHGAYEVLLWSMD